MNFLDNFGTVWMGAVIFEFILLLVCSYAFLPTCADFKASAGSKPADAHIQNGVHHLIAQFKCYLM